MGALFVAMVMAPVVVSGAAATTTAPSSTSRVIGVGVGTFVVLFFAVVAVVACIASCGTTAARWEHGVWGAGVVQAIVEPP